MTTVALLARARERHGDRLAIADGDVRLSYDELAEAVWEAARAFMAVGVQPGDRVCLWLPNGWQWVVAALGAQHAGAALVPLNTRYVGVEALDILARGRIRVLVVAERFLGRDYVATLREASESPAPGSPAPAPRLDALELIVRVPLGEEPSADAGPGVISWSELTGRAAEVSRARADERAAAVGPDDVADILFTSGTTGRPKGTMTAHRQTVAVAQAWADRGEVSADDAYLLINPFFHSFGYKAGFVVCLDRGATILPQRAFDLDALIDAVERDSASIVAGPPTIFQTLLANPGRERRDLSSLRLAVTGAAMVPVALVERMLSELTFSSVLTAYGLTEAVVVTMCRAQDAPEVVAHTSGCPTADFEIRIAGPDGAALPPGEDGEILLRGPNVMLGYLDDPEATAEAVRDGWLHTGDVGHLDANGYLTITDRVKNMFTVGGFNVYPAEIEGVIAQLGDVVESTVIGLPDERLGEVPVAFVIARPGSALTVEGVIEHCRARLANFKRPRAVELVDSLPRNATGKVLKERLREQAISAAARR